MTVAVRVTGWPNVAGLGEENSDTVVAAGRDPLSRANSARMRTDKRTSTAVDFANSAAIMAD